MTEHQRITTGADSAPAIPVPVRAAARRRPAARPARSSCSSARSVSAPGAQQEHHDLAAAEHRRNFVPEVRVATVKASDGTMAVSCPATTSAFAAANIFARAAATSTRARSISATRSRRATCSPPSSRPSSTIRSHRRRRRSASSGAVQQAHANRDSPSVTWQRDQPLVKKGWLPQQQGTIDG